MHILSLVLFLLCFGCASWHSPYGDKVVANSRASYTLQDVSGKYRVYKETVYKDKKSRLLTKFIVKDKLSQEELEKTLAISKIKKNRVFPYVSQHTVWLEKKRFFSQIKYVHEKNAYEVTLESPEEKWSGVRYIDPPPGQILCFFSQVADCIQNNGVLDQLKKDADIEIDIVVIWDNYPFYSEQYIGLAEDFYSIGSIKIDGLQGAMLRLSLEVQGQVIFYTYNEKFEFQNIYWIAQGYRLEKNGLRSNEDL